MSLAKAGTGAPPLAAPLPSLPPRARAVMTHMFVKKRSGALEPVQFDKITQRIAALCEGLDAAVDPVEIAKKVIDGLYNGVTTVELDELAADNAAYRSVEHPDFAVLAARLAISNLHKQMAAVKFSTNAEALYAYRDKASDRHTPLIALETLQIIRENAALLDAAIDYQRDYEYSYFGFRTLEKSYLLRMHNRVSERPQDSLMRVSIGIHGRDVRAAIETYHAMSGRYFTHASPTLFNAGTPKPQMSSCFLLAMQSDSIEGIYATVAQCASVSKTAGGIGLHIHNIRASGAYIAGTNGYSNGVVPMLKVFDATARYVDQGGNKRPGAFAIYLEPWHADIRDFLKLKRNNGKDDSRARNLFYGLWLPDLFMRRVEAAGMWTLMCPSESPGLADVHGAAFDELYERYEREGCYRKRIPAQELWSEILESQIETGMPYFIYKDAANAKSNQQNLGTIKSSNLCTEVIQYSSAEEVAVCNLASIALPRFVLADAAAPGAALGFAYDFAALGRIVRLATRNLNKIIDGNAYPLPEARRSNLRHRPLGLGVQGLADVFLLLKMPFDAPEARALNVRIFETIYYSALAESCALAQRDGAYPSYHENGGCPVSRGVLQPDMWGVATDNALWDWTALRADIAQHGVRNSLLVAPMPTASTSQILGNNECIEPYTSNLYNRRVSVGEFVVINTHLVRDLIARGLWTPEIRARIVAENGSVKPVPGLPEDLKHLYRTVWEIPQKSIVDMAADRAPYVDQSQSLNIHIAKPTTASLTSMHFHGWRRGLKTGMYYLRTRAAADPIKFALDPALLQKLEDAKLQARLRPSAGVANRQGAGEADADADGDPAPKDALLCRRDNPNCDSCGS